MTKLNWEEEFEDIFRSHFYDWNVDDILSTKEYKDITQFIKQTLNNLVEDIVGEELPPICPANQRKNYKRQQLLDKAKQVIGK